MNISKQLALIISFVCHAHDAKATILTKTVQIAQKAVGAYLVVASTATAHSYWWKKDTYGIEHLAPLTAPAAARGAAMTVGLSSFPQNTVGVVLASLEALASLGCIAESLHIKPINAYCRASSSKFDALLLGAATVQALDSSYKAYKKIQACRAAKKSEQTTSSHCCH